MGFANDFHLWLRHLWKLLANRLTRDPKIVIHGNSCIILYISSVLAMETLQSCTKPSIWSAKAYAIIEQSWPDAIRCWGICIYSDGSGPIYVQNWHLRPNNYPKKFPMVTKSFLIFLNQTNITDSNKNFLSMNGFDVFSLLHWGYQLLPQEYQYVDIIVKKHFYITGP